MTPAQRHRGEDIQILENRDVLYQRARAEDPSRWSGATRNWKRPGVMTLNPDKKPDELEKAA